MCRVLGVFPSGYYAWRRWPPSARSDAQLTAVIGQVHTWSRGTRGVPRMVRELRDRGQPVNPKRVARLMRKAGLQGVSRRKSAGTTRRDADAPAAPDLVDRDFSASGPDALWVADITYVPTWSGFLYLAVVLDAWSRRVVGWATAGHLRTELVVQALDMALGQRRLEGVIHRSDQGCQYSSLAFGRGALLLPSEFSVVLQGGKESWRMSTDHGRQAEGSLQGGTPCGPGSAGGGPAPAFQCPIQSCGSWKKPMPAGAGRGRRLAAVALAWMHR